jgi:hypothetical protein
MSESQSMNTHKNNYIHILTRVYESIDRCVKSGTSDPLAICQPSFMADGKDRYLLLSLLKAGDHLMRPQ